MFQELLHNLKIVLGRNATNGVTLLYSGHIQGVLLMSCSGVWFSGCYAFSSEATQLVPLEHRNTLHLPLSFEFSLPLDPQVSAVAKHVFIRMLPHCLYAFLEHFWRGSCQTSQLWREWCSLLLLQSALTSKFQRKRKNYFFSWGGSQISLYGSCRIMDHLG